jgi:hypothetical protein
LCLLDPARYIAIRVTKTWSPQVKSARDDAPSQRYQGCVPPHSVSPLRVRKRVSFRNHHTVDEHGGPRLDFFVRWVRRGRNYARARHDGDPSKLLNELMGLTIGFGVSEKRGDGVCIEEI